jgi:hypothetical protein
MIPRRRDLRATPGSPIPGARPARPFTALTVVGYRERVIAQPLLAFRVGLAATLVLVAAGVAFTGHVSAAEDKRPAPGAQPPRVTVSHPSGQARIDVQVDGKPFTAYIWPGTLKKPTLYPVVSANGVVVTRGFPPGTGERADHPHHVGLWFNYGDVNGYDFWNHSSAIIDPARLEKMGRIVHVDVTKMDSGRGQAELGVQTRWVTASNGTPLVDEDTTFTFRATADGLRVIDRATYLRAAGQDVAFTDNKEGMLGLRVRRALEDPAEKGGEFVDAAGKVTKTAALDSTGVTGVYTSSEGKTGAKVWGTRGKWTTLGGTVDGRPVTIAILDHPGNPGYPTYWHARGYGLFAANPLGQAVFSEGKEKLGFLLKRGQNQLFRYRVLIADKAIAPAEMETHYQTWIEESVR